MGTKQERKSISNFSVNQLLEVSADLAKPEDKLPPRVRLSQSAGSMSFMFTMTADQARQLAATLIVLANEIDPGTV